jgi:hypothetical protein
MKNTFIKHMKVAAVALVILTVKACANMPTQVYTGQALPSDQTALVESGSYTNIVSLDGQSISGLNAAVLPGTHTMEIKPDGQPYREYLFWPRSNGLLTFAADAGHKYLVYVDFVSPPVPVEEAGTGFVWIGYVQDERTGERIAKTDPLPLGVERREYPTGGNFSVPRR